MNISLPASLRSWVEDQIESRGFGTASEFVRDMIRREREKSLLYQIDQSLAEAMQKPATPMKEVDWNNIRKAGQQLAMKRKKKT